jgi:peptidoglycan/xylan/chitin deacetylase (PgdA/CDA1 family)
MLQKRVQELCGIDIVERKIDAVYRSALAGAKSPPAIPVLLFHRVVPDAPINSHHGIWVTAQSFEHNLQSLTHRGYSSITFEQYHLFLSGGFILPKKPVVLTFDDGYEDNYFYAFPLLKKYGFSAVIFLVADTTRRTNFWDANEPQVPLMSNEQIHEMSASGIEFGSHTVTHPNLSHCSPDQARKELVESKQMIEQLTGNEIISLAYPYGAVNETIKSLAAETGYIFGIATNSGPLNFYEDFLEIRRTQIFPWTDKFGFWKKTQQWYLRYKRRKSNEAV